MTALPQDVSQNPLPYFPTAFVVAIADSLRGYMPDKAIVERSLGMEDPSGTIGVYAEEWNADEATFQMGGQIEPVISRYTLCVANVVKATDQELGRAMYANDAKSIRVILYRDPDLRVRLGDLQEVMMNTVERAKKFRVIRQRYMSARISGVFQFVATTDVVVETETTLL